MVDSQFNEDCLADLHELRTLLNDPDPTVRGKAVIAIEKLRDSESIPTLRALLNDPELMVRGCAASAIGALGDTESIPKLRTLQDDDLACVSAAISLSFLGVPDAKECVASSLKRTFNRTSRAFLFWHLDRMCNVHEDDDAELFLRFVIDAVLHPEMCEDPQWILDATTYRVFQDKCLPAIRHTLKYTLENTDYGFTDEAHVLQNISLEIREKATATRPFDLSLSDCPDKLDTSFLSAVKWELLLTRNPELREELERKKWTQHGKPKTKKRPDGHIQVSIRTDIVAMVANQKNDDPALLYTVCDSIKRLKTLMRSILSEEEHVAIYSRYYEKLSQQKIAEKLGVTTRTVRRYEEDAKSKLRESELIKSELISLSSASDSSFDRPLLGD